MDLHSPKDYWDQVATEKQFLHPLRIDWLASNLAGKDILDCGCGYGRLLGELAKSGYRDTVGTDFSRGMLKRCAEMLPDVTFRLVQTDGRMLPFREESFDAVLQASTVMRPRGCSAPILILPHHPPFLHCFW